MLSEIPTDRYNSDFRLAFSARIHFSVNQCVLAPRNQAGPEGPKQLKVIIMHRSIRHWPKCSFGGRENSNRTGSKAPLLHRPSNGSAHSGPSRHPVLQAPGLLGISHGITSKQGQLTWNRARQWPKASSCLKPTFYFISRLGREEENGSQAASHIPEWDNPGNWC